MVNNDADVSVSTHVSMVGVHADADVNISTHVLFHLISRSWGHERRRIDEDTNEDTNEGGETGTMETEFQL